MFVPFYSQHWDLDQWKSLGFTSRDEAEYWQRSCCGVLCFLMAHDALKGVSNRDPKSISDVIREGVELGIYTDETGWSHTGLCRLAEKYGLNAERKELSYGDICSELQSGNFVIVSVKFGFRNKKSLKEKILFWKKYGGHLVLCTGCDDSGIFVHHTSIREAWNRKDWHVSEEEFMKGYTGRGIVIKN